MFANVDYPQVRIADKIERFFTRNHTFSIASTYKGLILTNPIRVLDVLPHCVVFQAPDLRLCFTLREKVHLYSHALSEAITAQVLELNLILGKISLSDLAFSGRSWKDRHYERIQPQNMICVDFSSQKITSRAQLKDLSTTGMSLLVSRARDKRLCTDRDAPVRLALQLPKDDFKMDLKGKIINSRQSGNLVIIGVSFVPNKSQEKRLHQYIQARKTEILNELESEFHKLLEPPQIQDMFF